MKYPLREAAERLNAAGVESARAEARILWEHARFEKPVFELLLQRRVMHEPMAYIIGRKEFWSLDFEVGPGVLIPRPETETLVEQALVEFPARERPYRVLDLGTGSGCLLIALLKAFPNATGLGIDDSDAALGWACRNLASHGLNDRGALSKGNWSAAECSFDLIVSNPPYIPSGYIAALPPDVGDYEPKEALDGGPDGMSAYRDLTPVLLRCLKADGVALLEIGVGQHQIVVETMEADGLIVPRLVPDLAGIPRCLVIRRP